MRLILNMSLLYGFVDYSGKETNSFDVLTELEVVRRLTVLKLTAK